MRLIRAWLAESSGTSMIAQMLSQCGLYLGPPDTLLKADAANPQIVEVAEAVLALDVA